MPRYVALLRGINVGGHRVKMDHLRELFEALDFSSVETFIASGNVIFDSPARDAAALERKIEKHLKQSLGYEVATFIRTLPELAAAAVHQPFPAAEMEAPGHSVYVLFLAAEPGAEARKAIEGLRTEKDEFRVHGREIYWLCRGRLLDSLVPAPVMAKTMKGMQNTSRNLTTVRKLAARYPAPE